MAVSQPLQTWGARASGGAAWVCGVNAPAVILNQPAWQRRLVFASLDLPPHSTWLGTDAPSPYQGFSLYRF